MVKAAIAKNCYKMFIVEILDLEFELESYHITASERNY